MALGRRTSWGLGARRRGIGFRKVPERRTTARDKGQSRKERSPRQRLFFTLLLYRAMKRARGKGRKAVVKSRPKLSVPRSNPPEAWLSPSSAWLPSSEAENPLEKKELTPVTLSSSPTRPLTLLVLRPIALPERAVMLSPVMFKLDACEYRDRWAFETLPPHHE